MLLHTLGLLRHDRGRCVCKARGWCSGATALALLLFEAPRVPPAYGLSVFFYSMGQNCKNYRLVQMSLATNFFFLQGNNTHKEQKPTSHPGPHPAPDMPITFCNRTLCTGASIMCFKQSSQTRRRRAGPLQRSRRRSYPLRLLARPCKPAGGAPSCHPLKKA